MTKKKNKGGRPAKFKERQQLVDVLTGYFENCDEARQMPNKAGLCLWLNISRDTYNEYKKKPGFSDAIKACEAMIENAWVQRLAGTTPTGAIFYLKNAFSDDYRDRTEHTGKDGGALIISFDKSFAAAPEATGGSTE
jgi:hypothetical protein